MFQMTEKQKKQILDMIHDYYLDERGENIGLIHQEGLYDLFMEQLAPLIYNKALDDAKKWYTQRVNEMESDYYLMYKDL